MTIRVLNKSTLEKFIFSEEYERLPNLPVSRHRALSQIKNPRAEENDGLLFLAYEGEEMVGYLGIFPDWLYAKDEVIRAGWLSCLWTDTRLRGKGIAKKLLRKAFDTWNNNILVTEFTPVAGNLYRTLGLFESQKTLEGTRLYFRFSLHTLLPPKHPFFQKTTLLFKITDGLLNFVFDSCMRLRPVSSPQVRVEYIEQIDDEITGFITAMQGGELTRRRKAELQWITSNPWILGGAAPDNYSVRYAFSSVDKVAEFVKIKLRNEAGRIVGFLLLFRRNGHLKVPYCYCDTENLGEVAQVLFQYAKQHKISVLTVFHEALAGYLLAHSSPALFKKTLRREYLFSKQLASSFQDTSYSLQAGDGDCAFT